MPLVCFVVVLLYCACVVSFQCCFSPLQDVFPMSFSAGVFQCVMYLASCCVCLCAVCVLVVVACTIDGNQC